MKLLIFPYNLISNPVYFSAIKTVLFSLLYHFFPIVSNALSTTNTSLPGMYPEWVHTTFLSFITKTWGIAEILNALYSSLFGSSSTSKGHFFPFTRDLTLAIALASSIDTAIIRTLFFQESSKSFNASSSLWQGLHQVAQNDTITGPCCTASLKVISFPPIVLRLHFPESSVRKVVGSRLVK